MSQLASVADKVHDLSPSPQINVTSSGEPERNSSLQAQIAQLTQQYIFNKMIHFIISNFRSHIHSNWYPLSVSCLDTYMKHRGEGATIESYGAGKLCSWKMHSRG
ncbi:unnamed protein product [Larinioides sclopetarius]|uniref:Uncharacterized protein n=1 Tax=Larinioides sclopetarius TaxID=280406 RepID=A0AAV1ZEF3_9ARAC